MQVANYLMCDTVLTALQPINVPLLSSVRPDLLTLTVRTNTVALRR